MVRIPNTVLELIHEGRARFSLREIVGSVFGGGAVKNAARMLGFLARQKAEAITADTVLEEVGGELAKRIETLITKAPGDVAARQRLAGAIGTNFGLAAVGLGDAGLRLSQSQAALEAARGSDGEEAAREAREADEKRFVLAFQELGRLARSERAL